MLTILTALAPNTLTRKELDSALTAGLILTNKYHRQVPADVLEAWKALETALTKWRGEMKP